LVRKGVDTPLETSTAFLLFLFDLLTCHEHIAQAVLRRFFASSYLLVHMDLRFGCFLCTGRAKEGPQFVEKLFA
jgi:hypothetical protein